MHCSYFEFPKLKKGAYIVRITTTISRKVYTIESNKVTATLADNKPRAMAQMKVDVTTNKRREELNNSGFFSLVGAAVVVLAIVYKNK